MTTDNGNIRAFGTGATRDTAEGKLDFEGFLSPVVLLQYAKYMNMNRLQSDGTLRDSDNWQKGIPREVYMKSMWRHFFEVWHTWRTEVGYGFYRAMMSALCGLLFNVMGMMHELLKEYPMVDFDGEQPTDEMRKRKENL